MDAGTAVHVPQMNFLMAVSVAKQQQQQHLFQKGHGTMHGLYSVGVGATEGAVPVGKSELRKNDSSQPLEG